MDRAVIPQSHYIVKTHHFHSHHRSRNLLPPGSSIMNEVTFFSHFVTPLLTRHWNTHCSTDEAPGCCLPAVNVKEKRTDRNNATHTQSNQTARQNSLLKKSWSRHYLTFIGTELLYWSHSHSSSCVLYHITLTMFNKWTQSETTTGFNPGISLSDQSTVKTPGALFCTLIHKSGH